MFDSFWYGIFVELFGPAGARWLSQFKYWTIFLVATMGTYAGLFVAKVYAKGWHLAVDEMLKNSSTLSGLMVPIGVGVIAVFVAFAGS